ncbi:MAG: monovalent cation:proton antiporter-2 (CPA2) family protein [Pseudomonadota bacterium]|nr:monovalent cation:proton antiporter-2 (CPA2) family protein [Pseudomonadota bacterium]
MTGNFLIQAAVFLAAAAIAAPLAKKLNISSVLGYLAAGMLIGPYGLGFVYAVYEVEGILHFAEYGVALLLFLIGLELKPKRLWTMRGSIFGLGAAQVLATAAALVPLAAWALGIGWTTALFIGLALALSSTAFVLQVLEEKGELTTRHGRAAFSVLLFQDLAAIPLIAIVPLLGSGVDEGGLSLAAAGKAVGAVALVVVVGRYALSKLYRLVASTGVREAMTASALLTVVCVALIMEEAGLSVALGTFLAGALLADSPYSHQIEADIAPFEGLLIGLFFTAVGMALNLHLLTETLGLILALVAGLLVTKAVVLYALGRWNDMDGRSARRLALAVSQGGEFAFVLFAAAVGANVIGRDLAQLLSVVVTMSMLATPVLLLVDDMLSSKAGDGSRPFDKMPEEQGHVVIAGFGRFGQIVARVLRARGIPFTALDDSAAQVDFVARFGAKAYYGDPSRLPILRAAQTGKARAFVLAMDNVEGSLKTAEVVRRNFPNVPIYARARNRNHVHRLMALGVETIRRETFLSSLDLTREVLLGLGIAHEDVEHTVERFRELDERRLLEDFDHYKDLKKLQERALKYTEELEEMFSKDATELAEPGKEHGAD